MDFYWLSIITIFLGVLLTEANGSFYQYYSPLWGFNHLTVDPQGTQVQLLMDNSSGAGFRSKLEYGSGWFHIKMKIPDKKTGGIVTTFYLTSAPDNEDQEKHFELDYEFLGTNGTVQTNVYNNDEGHREQTFNLGFNPSEDFHSYEILWNPHQIVFFVDKIPIRVFKNNTEKGVEYPWKPMHVKASIWNAEWAGTVDWSQAPFIAQYEDFDFFACQADGNSFAECGSDKYLWNKQWRMNPHQRQRMAKYRNMFMVYDYCSKPSTRKVECSYNY